MKKNFVSFDSLSIGDTIRFGFKGLSRKGEIGEKGNDSEGPFVQVKHIAGYPHLHESDISKIERE